jgi:branched-chain amino acid transport system substrate-binding protein
MRLFIFFFACLALMSAGAGAVPPIVVGLSADMSGSGRESGLAIQRGATVAMEEINERGGVLGRPLRLEVRDHLAEPEIGADDIRSFAANDQVVAVLGGLHTPVVLNQLTNIHGHEIPFLNPWAAGTAIVDNGFHPNYVFRASVRDEWAGGFLVDVSHRKGYRKFGLALIRNPWGRSNQRAMTQALATHGLDPVGIEWILGEDDDFAPKLDNLLGKGADVIILVGDVPHSLPVVRAMARLPEAGQVPIVSHWGLTSGDLFDRAQDELAKIDLSFLQTYSFFNPHDADRNDAFIRRYADISGTAPVPASIESPVGAAHAYDLIHMLAAAIDGAGETDRTAIREALENLRNYNGLVRSYDRPFSASRHEALSVQDYILAEFGPGGEILPKKF